MPIHGRGPQVVLEGYARTVARGSAGRTMRDNIAAMDALVIAGLVADGNTVDGTSRSGGTPYEVVVAQFPDETLSAYEIPAPLLKGIGGSGGSGLFTDITVNGPSTLNGNLSINYATVYTGGRVDPKKAALNIQQTASGFTSGQDWIGLNNVNITSDTLNVNGTAPVQTNFQGSINGTTLTIAPGTLTGVTVISLASASISGTVLTIVSTYTGHISAGMTLQWPGGSDTVVSGGFQTFNLAHNNGTVTAQAMGLIGPVPLATLAWYPPGSTDQQSATILSFASGNDWIIDVDQGIVPLQPMQTIVGAAALQAIGWYHLHTIGGAGFGGSRTAARFSLQQYGGPIDSHNNYQGVLSGVSMNYPSGGSDLWSGSAGNAWGAAVAMSLTKRPVTAVGSPGPVNYRGFAGMEIDYGCAAGSPDDPAYPKASASSIGGLTVIRFASHQWVPAIWESDFAISVGQQASSTRDAGGNVLPPKGAKFGYRLAGPVALDPLQGRALGFAFAPGQFRGDGTPAATQSRHGVDWYNVDWTGTQFRGQGFSVLGSGGPFTAGAVQVGGGYLSATATTVSLDTAGSVCTGATVAGAGAILYPGLPLIHDDTGTVAIVTAVDNAVRAGVGGATAVALVPNTGRAPNARLPANPVQFRVSAVPITFPAPGPTGPTLTLTWTAPTALSLQPSGGAVVMAGLKVAANDAAAATAGVPLHGCYLNGTAMQVRQV